MRARLHGAHGDAQPLGDRGVTEALEVAETDHLPLVVTDRVERHPDLERLPDVLETGTRRGVVDLGQLGGRLLLAVDVDGGPAGDRIDPGSDLPLRVV